SELCEGNDLHTGQGMMLAGTRGSVGRAVGIVAYVVALAFPPGAGAQTNGALARRVRIPKAAQRPGDPRAGYLALTSREWVGCGAPAVYYDLLMALLPERWEPKFET